MLTKQNKGRTLIYFQTHSFPDSFGLIFGVFVGCIYTDNLQVSTSFGHYGAFFQAVVSLFALLRRSFIALPATQLSMACVMSIAYG